MIGVNPQNVVVLYVINTAASLFLMLSLELNPFIPLHASLFPLYVTDVNADIEENAFSPMFVTFDSSVNDSIAIPENAFDPIDVTPFQ